MAPNATLIISITDVKTKMAWEELIIIAIINRLVDKC